MVTILLPPPTARSCSSEQTVLKHEDYMDAIIEVQAKKKKDLNYYA